MNLYRWWIHNISKRYSSYPSRYLLLHCHILVGDKTIMPEIYSIKMVIYYPRKVLTDMSTITPTRYGLIMPADVAKQFVIPMRTPAYCGAISK